MGTRIYLLFGLGKWDLGLFWVTGTGNIDTELGMRKPVYYYKGSRANFDREFV
jgi:hypothetical protein